jgi:FAD/FMN-containing dehydrogenase
VVSTNAGGTQVLRYGTTRDLVLGLEAVLPNGEVWSGLKRLRKDNTGYDLKQLLIGAEGTLGVVTAAALNHFPVLVSRATAVAAVDSPEIAIQLLVRAKETAGGAVEAFELMGRRGVEFVLNNIPNQRDPLPQVHPWYVLVEIASGEPGAAEAAMSRLLEQGLEDGLIRDAVVAQTAAQAKALWSVRENQSPGQKPEGATWKHDISVPVSQVARFIAEAGAAMERFAPGARITAFGHVGDGNIHYDVIRPDGGSDAEHSARRIEGSRIVHDIAVGLGGSISAEHGLGAMKTDEARRYKAPAEIAALEAIRQALDPRRIMNPRVLF